MTNKNKAVGIFIRILALAFFCLLLFFAFTEARKFSYDIFADEAYKTKAEAGENVEVEVTEGESIKEVAEDLKDKGIIGNSFKFTLALKYMDGSENIRAGTYSLNASMKPSEILKELTQQEEY